MSDSVVAARQAQRAWAEARGIALDADGYVTVLDHNLFQGLSQSARAEFRAGSGDELGGEGSRGKMQALHSSSALACNVFDFWRTRLERLSELLLLPSRIERMEFERQCPTGLQGTPPNLDVVLHVADGVVIGIESKFLEPYAGERRGTFSSAYFPAEPGLWTRADLPECQRLAGALEGGSVVYDYLDAHQLLKHALGLRRTFGDRAALWYLWFDVDGTAGVEHRREVQEFAAAVGRELRFRALSYQELIPRLCARRTDDTAEYGDYLASRYLRTMRS